MGLLQVFQTINRMQADGVIGPYAIGGAVAATFYLEPVATLDVDIFVAMSPFPGQVVISVKPIYDYLTARGCALEREYIRIADWPVQFLAPSGALVEEALRDAVQTDIAGEPVHVFSAEHLAAIAIQTGRPKDKARLLDFLPVLDKERFRQIVARHGLDSAWEHFRLQFDVAEK